MPSDDPWTLAQQVQQATVESLLDQLGLALASPGSTRDGGAHDRSKDGENWLERNADELRAKLCGSPRFAKATDSVTDIATIADVLSPAYGQHTAFIVAAIVLKRGIDLLCS